MFGCEAADRCDWDDNAACAALSGPRGTRPAARENKRSHYARSSLRFARMTPIRLVALLAAFALSAAACSGGDDAATTSSTTTATTATTRPSVTTTTAAPSITASPTTTTATTVAPTTTSTTAAIAGESVATTIPALLGSPLNGLAAVDESLVTRDVVAVKIDNHPNARPQSSLQEANAVVEILVEGGFTRFIALFHDNDSTYLGPVRSVRPTDVGVVRPLGATLSISGGQAWIQRILASNDVGLIGEGTAGMFRIGSRRAPHNLYADTAKLRQVSIDRGYEDEFLNPLYDVGEFNLPENEVTEIVLDWAVGNVVTWRYEDGVYRRWVGSNAHNWLDRDGNTGPLEFDLLVVILGHRYTASPPSGTSGSSVPATETTGSDKAFIFYQGTVRLVDWTRDSITESFTFTAASGNQIAVPPGTPWVAIFPRARPYSWS